MPWQGKLSVKICFIWLALILPLTTEEFSKELIKPASAAASLMRS